MTLTVLILEVFLSIFFIFMFVKLFERKGLLHKKTVQEKELFFASLVDEQDIFSVDVWELTYKEREEFNAWYKKNRCQK